MAKKIKITKEFGKRLPRLGSQEGTVLLGDVFEGMVKDIGGLQPYLGVNAGSHDLENLIKETSRVCHDGVLEGLYGIDPSTPSTQATGAGDTEWRIDITPGFAMISGLETLFTATLDFDVHSGSKLLDAGQNVPAFLIGKYSATGPEIDVVVGTPFNGTIADNLGAHRIAARNGFLYDGDPDFVTRPILGRVLETWNAVEVVTGLSRYFDHHKLGYDWIYVAYLVLERTADMVVGQTVINGCRDVIGMSQRENELLRRIQDAVIKANENELNVENA